MYRRDGPMASTDSARIYLWHTIWGYLVRNTESRDWTPDEQHVRSSSGDPAWEQGAYPMQPQRADHLLRAPSLMCRPQWFLYVLRDFLLISSPNPGGKLNPKREGPEDGYTTLCPLVVPGIECELQRHHPTHRKNSCPS